jgi:cellulose synthase/poly-beta-1,6-N-acetylglucosamine synthase-like glycosyltransferase
MILDMITEQPVSSNPIQSGTLPRITVAVCVRNGAKTLDACLHSLAGLEYPAERLEILVVDNASTDETLEIASRYPAKVITESRVGRGFARETAWRSATGKLIAFTDADCVADSKWLLDLIPVFSDPGVGVAGGRIITMGEDAIAKFYEMRRIVSNEEFSGDYPFSPPFLATANAIFRRDALVACGGFDPDITVGEDADICWRIGRLGYRIRYVPAGIIYHHHRESLSGLFRQSIEYGFHGIFLAQKYRAWFPKKTWIWWGLYFRLMLAALRFPFILLRRNSLNRKLALCDLIRYSGLAIGRIKATFKLGFPGF